MRIVPITQAAEPVRLPDLIWDAAGFFGDIAIDTSTADLACGATIETAVLICLMTDRRVDASELPEGESNRGWPGDGFDMQPGEEPLGSKLWLLRRRALTDDIDTEAEDYAREALQTLIRQGLCVRTDVTVERRPADNRLDLEVRLYGRDGSVGYQQRFAVLWDQVGRTPTPAPVPTESGPPPGTQFLLSPVTGARLISPVGPGNILVGEAR